MLTFSVLRILMTKFPRHVTIVLQPTSQGLTAGTNNGSLLSDPATLPAKKQLIIDWKLQKNSNTLLNHTPEMTLATLYFLLKLKILSKLKSLVFSIRLSQQLQIRSSWETRLWITKVNLMLRAAGRTLSQSTTWQKITPIKLLQIMFRHSEPNSGNCFNNIYDRYHLIWDTVKT